MASDTVTLELTGDVSLGEFATAVRNLDALLKELSREVADGVEIVWMVDALEQGSALTAFRGLSSGVDGVAHVESVVRAYADIGAAMMNGDRIRYSTPVQTHAQAIASVINGRVQAIRFETADAEAIVTARSRETPSPRLDGRVSAYGAVEGRVQTLSSRGGLRFTLYDTLRDKAVSCYLRDDFNQELMRDVWGRRALVEGWVTRDAESGRPLTIRRVSNVTPRPEGHRDDYRRARGAMRDAWAGIPSEQVIRQLRDA